MGRVFVSDNDQENREPVVVVAGKRTPPPRTEAAREEWYRKYESRFANYFLETS